MLPLIHESSTTLQCDAFIIACYKQFKAHTESMLLDTQICKRLVSCTVAMSETQRLAQQMCHPVVLQTMAATYRSHGYQW